MNIREEINKGGELIERLKLASLVFETKVDMVIEKLQALGQAKIAMLKLYELLETSEYRTEHNETLIGVPVADFNFIIDALSSLIKTPPSDNDFQDAECLLDDISKVLGIKKDYEWKGEE